MNRSVISLDSCALCGEAEGWSAASVMPNGTRPLAVTPVARMLPTFLGPLLMVLGESPGDTAKGR